MKSFAATLTALALAFVIGCTGGGPDSAPDTSTTAPDTSSDEYMEAMTSAAEGDAPAETEADAPAETEGDAPAEADAPAEEAAE